MARIIPAVLALSKESLEETLHRLARIPSVDAVQIDVIDGVFAGPANWPYTEQGNALANAFDARCLLPYADRFRFEVDLMVQRPEQVIGGWVAAGVSSVTVHAESVSSLPHFLAEFRATYGHDKDFAPGLISLGLALGLESAVALIEPYLHAIDYVQFMGIAHIGRQGEPFDERVLARIRSFRAAHPHLPIQVDGAATEVTAPQLFSAGASRLIVGHDLLQAKDMAMKFKTLEDIAERYAKA